MADLETCDALGRDLRLKQNTDLKSVQRRPDGALIIGLSSAILLIIIALVISGSLVAFYNVPAILIVFLGTIAVTMISFNMTDLINAGIESLGLFLPKFQNEQDARDKAIRLAVLGKEQGILALDRVNAALASEPFLQRAVALVVDGNEGINLDSALSREIVEVVKNRERSVLVLRRISEVAPSMGLIGTLVGLIQLLGNLDSPSEIGPAMAVALLTTFYGAVLAYMIFAPLAAKLEDNIGKEALVNEIYKAGVVSISKQEPIHALEMYLNTEMKSDN